MSPAFRWGEWGRRMRSPKSSVSWHRTPPVIWPARRSRSTVACSWIDFGVRRQSAAATALSIVYQGRALSDRMNRYTCEAEKSKRRRRFALPAHSKYLRALFGVLLALTVIQPRSSSAQDARELQQERNA